MRYVACACVLIAVGCKQEPARADHPGGAADPGAGAPGSAAAPADAAAVPADAAAPAALVALLRAVPATVRVSSRVRDPKILPEHLVSPARRRRSSCATGAAVLTKRSREPPARALGTKPLVFE